MAMMKKDAPDYRVYAFANIEIEDFLGKNPYTLSDPGKVKWEVEADGDAYVATGTIKVPVAMRFSEVPDDDDDLKVDMIVIKGETVLDNGPKADPVQDPNYGIDEIKMMADARHMRKGQAD